MIATAQLQHQLTTAQQLCAAGWHRPLYVTGAITVVRCQECGADVVQQDGR